MGQVETLHSKWLQVIILDLLQNTGFRYFISVFSALFERRRQK